jgi:hypothetical protein
MFGSLGLGILLLVVGLIVAVALPGAGIVVGAILIVVAIAIMVGGIAAGRRRAPAPRA